MGNWACGCHGHGPWVLGPATLGRATQGMIWSVLTAQVIPLYHDIITSRQKKIHLKNITQNKSFITKVYFDIKHTFGVSVL